MSTSTAGDYRSSDNNQKGNTAYICVNNGTNSYINLRFDDGLYICSTTPRAACNGADTCTNPQKTFMKKQIILGVILLVAGVMIGFFVLVNWQLSQEVKKTELANFQDSQRLTAIEKYLTDTFPGNPK